MGRELVLISGDGELAAAVAAVLPEADRLTVVDPEEDLPAFAGPALGGPAVVVVDLPPASRHGVCEHLRANYPGQVIVLVDPGEGSGEDPAGDAGRDAGERPAEQARRVLVRPVEPADLIAGLPPPEPARPTRVSVSRRQRGHSPSPQGLGRLVPPAPVAGPTGAAPVPVGAASVPAGAGPVPPGDLDGLPERLAPGQPVWEVEAAGAKVGEATVNRSAGPARRPLAAAVALVVLVVVFAVGTAVGASQGGQPLPRPSPLTPPATVAAPTRIVVRQTSPPACLAAIDDADAVIAYLVANMHDRRVAASLRQYRTASRTCRRAKK